MDTLNLESLALKKATNAFCEDLEKTKLPRHKNGEKFLKGPIPYLWLQRASKLHGKSFHVAIVLWFLAGLNNCNRIKLSQSILRDFGVDRHSKYRALKWLASEKLIVVENKPGCSPLITLLSVSDGIL